MVGGPYYDDRHYLLRPVDGLCASQPRYLRLDQLREDRPGEIEEAVAYAAIVDDLPRKKPEKAQVAAPAPERRG